MNENRLYVFFGYRTEYTLNPLYEYMKGKGYHCVEITPVKCHDMRKALLELSAEEYVFITSAHVFLDETYYQGKKSHTYLSVLEAMDILQPVKSVHYPHDLVTLVHEFDEPWLNSIFDVILFPVDGYAHLSCHGKPIYNVGWIKKHGKLGMGEKFKVGHGIGDLSYYKNFGPEYFYKTFKIVWEQGVVVKMGSLGKEKKFMSYLKKKNVKYISGSKSIFELIDSCEIMLTNSLTSVNMESALSGRFTINMLDGISDRRTHEKCFKGLPNLKIMSIRDTAELLREYYRGNFVPPVGEDVLKPFDFELAVKLITE